MDVRLVFAINGVTVDLGNELLRDRSGNSIFLRPQCFAVLRHLVEHADRLVTKEALMEAIWPGVTVTDDSLVQCIHQIRRALGDDGHAILKTVPKRGYRFILPTEAETDSPIAGAEAEQIGRRPKRTRCHCTRHAGCGCNTGLRLVAFGRSGGSRRSA